jgi:hypothetical protein
MNNSVCGNRNIAFRRFMNMPLEGLTIISPWFCREGFNWKSVYTKYGTYSMPDNNVSETNLSRLVPKTTQMPAGFSNRFLIMNRYIEPVMV